MQRVVAEALVVLGRLEHRQHVGPGPAGTAHRGPAVVIRRQAAHVDHGVERARPADHLAARPEDPAAAAAGLRHGVEAPVRADVLNIVTQSDGMSEASGAARPGLEHQHLAARDRR